MKQKKLKYIYIPFFKIALISFFIYDILSWLYLTTSLDAIEEGFLNIWIPIVFSVIVVAVFFRKKLKDLKFKKNHTRKENTLFSTMVLVIAIPIMLSQNYLKMTTYATQSIHIAAQIPFSKVNKYFIIDSLSLVQDLNLHEKHYHVSTVKHGKYNRRLSFELYIVSPFKSTDAIWYGVKYHKRISRKASDEEKQAVLDAFIKESLLKYNNIDFSTIKYLEKLSYSTNFMNFKKAILFASSPKNNKDVSIVSPRYESFKEIKLRSLFWTITSFVLSMLFLLFLVMKVEVKKII